VVSFFIPIFVPQTNTMSYQKLKRDDRQDIAIAITNKLIELGYVPDCTDTDDESEFEVQDLIADVLKENNLHKKTTK
jgi:hypothetical protein